MCNIYDKVELKDIIIIGETGDTRWGGTQTEDTLEGATQIMDTLWGVTQTEDSEGHQIEVNRLGLGEADECLTSFQ